MKGKIAVLAVTAVAGIAAGHAAGVAGSPRGAAAAIAYAEQQIGRPYVWGGPTAPGTGYGFDCSGLVMEAYRSAGVDIARTSQEQWATEPHVPSPQPGDLVFFAGGDGTAAAPGHVGIVIGLHQMIEAYAPGFPVRYSTFGLPSSPPGDTDPVGYTNPAARAAAR